MRAWFFTPLVGIIFLALYLTAWGGGSPNAPDLIPVCQIQGKSFSSSFLGKTVRVSGIVIADMDSASRRGFFLQEPGCDGDPKTSDALFVYLGQRLDLVRTGDRLEVAGTIEEYDGQTRLYSGPDAIVRLETGAVPPVSIEVTPPFSPSASRWYLESLEGMAVSVQAGVVVGPTGNDGRTWVVQANLGIARLFQGEAGGEGAAICVDDEGAFAITPEAGVGDRVGGLEGALEQRDGIYCLQLFSPPGSVLPDQEPLFPSVGRSSGSTNLEAAGTQSPLDTPDFTAATFNLAGLYDVYDDPGVQDDILTATEYQRRLEKRALAIHEALLEPDLVGVQEVENNAVLRALIARPELDAPYAVVWEDGPDLRGLDVALLYRSDRLVLLQSWTLQICTGLMDGLGPDGNEDVYHPANTLTCDRDGDGVLDGNRLFSRPPLIAAFRYCPSACTRERAAAEVWVINNHWKSRVEDGYAVAYTAPRRYEEAQEVRRLAQNILTTHPTATLIVLGDMNDEPGSAPLSRLLDLGLSNPWDWLPAIQRYSYIYHGISQSPDYILSRPGLPLWPAGFTPVPINADFPALFARVPDTFFGSSDHNPLTLRFIYFTYRVFLPAISFH